MTSVATVGCQSDIRDSAAQTVAYSPPLEEGVDRDTEVLTLTGMALPASLTEITVLEKSRQKRIFETMLPPGSDQFSFALRARLMEESEFRQWAAREKHIKDLQDRRLHLVVKLLIDKNRTIERGNALKVARKVKKCEEERDRALAAAQRERVKQIRKLHQAKLRALAQAGCIDCIEGDQVEGKTYKLKRGQRRDVLAEYTDAGSRVYAPLDREGHIPDTNTAKIEVQPADLSTYQGLVALEQTIPHSVLNVKVPDIVFSRGGDSKGESSPHVIQLKVKDDEETKQKQARALMERPETPRVKEDFLPEEEEQVRREGSVEGMKKLWVKIEGRRVLRGRAKQNSMYIGKGKRLDLINELRAGERWQRGVQSEEELQALSELKEAMVDGALEGVIGSTIAETLDELSKELVRFQEERRIAAMVKLAERDRRLRQAQESGRRQAEEMRREKEDEMFREIMGVHQGTVDSYLEEVLASTVDKVSTSRALQGARLKAQHIDNVIDKLEEEQAKEGGADLLVKDLLSSFLLPHVQRERVQRRVELESKRFVHSSSSVLTSTLQEVDHKVSDLAQRRKSAGSANGK